jgi:RNA polymerase sigma-70 factor (ECF subfamily)
MTKKLINEEEISLLLGDCVLRNERALEHLYKKVSSLLQHFAMGIVQNEALSNEILQDSFIQIWENAHKYDATKGTPLNWIRTIVRNKAIDKIRNENKHVKTRFYENDELLEDIPSPEQCQPDDILIKQESDQTISAYFDCLPSNQRMSLLLAYFHGYSRVELADSMNTNCNTVKSWLRRGLKTMRNQHVSA